MCMNHLSWDIIGLAETHLKNSENLQIAGYRWFGQNTESIHRNAKCGSGGVGFLVKEHILNEFDCKVLDGATEGILWLKFMPKLNNYSFLTCVCYLVPSNSTYHVNPNEYFDNLLCQKSEYQNIGPFCICGDFNVRCGDSSDFIDGIDKLPFRSVIDYTHNSYSELFIDFLLDVNCCIVNGRKSVLNDYTFVSPRSVVDYCLIPYENWHYISIFSVIRASSLVTDAGVLGNIDPSKLPDHSVLRWSFSLNCTFSTSAKSSFSTVRTKYDVRNISNDFLADESTNDKLTHVIYELESSVKKTSTVLKRRMTISAVRLNVQWVKN